MTGRSNKIRLNDIPLVLAYFLKYIFMPIVQCNVFHVGVFAHTVVIIVHISLWEWQKT